MSNNAEVRVLSDVDLIGSLILSQNPTDFPANPKQNTIIVKDGMPWIYSTLNSYNTWRPLVNINTFYIHTQGVASDMWVVNHNLGTVYFVYVAYDESGNVMYPAQIIPNNNGLQFQVRFAVPVVGTIVVFAATAGFGQGGTDLVFGGVLSQGTETISIGRYYFVGQAPGLSLPAGTPPVGARIQFYDSQESGFVGVPVSGNGNLIEGSSDDLSLDVSGYSAMLVFLGGGTGWRVY